MKRKLRIGMIGGGNMGAAIIAGIRTRCSVYVCELDKRRAQSLKRKYRIGLGDLQTVVNRSDVIILAIKPQGFEGLLKELKGLSLGKKLIVSIAAGITTKYIEKKLGSNVKVVRTMPNLPAQVQSGMTGICSGKNATRADLNKVSRIFSNIGETIIVEEKWMDALTAVSGSGPAYLFYFAELLQKSAKSLGLKDDISKKLVYQTLKGSLDLLLSSKEDAATLRKRVTSKGGTTQAALSVLEKKKIDKTFKAALAAAKKRSKQLSK